MEATQTRSAGGPTSEVKDHRIEEHHIESQGKFNPGAVLLHQLYKLARANFGKNLGE